MQDWDFKGGVLRGTGIQSTSWELSFNSQAQAQPSSVSYSSWYLFPKGIDHILPPFLVHCGSRKIRIYIFLLTAEAQCLAPTGSRSHILVGWTTRSGGPVDSIVSPLPQSYSTFHLRTFTDLFLALATIMGLWDCSIRSQTEQKSFGSHKYVQLETGKQDDALLHPAVSGPSQAGQPYFVDKHGLFVFRYRSPQGLANYRHWVFL